MADFPVKDTAVETNTANIPTKGSAAMAGATPVTLATDDTQFGADGTGIAQPNGGSGVRGWLSGIYKAVTGTLTFIFAPATLTDRSNSVTIGGTAQILMPANAARKGGRIQNTSNGDLWFRDISATGLDASAGGAACFRLAAGGYFETPPGGASQTAWSIYGASTGQTFSATEW